MTDSIQMVIKEMVDHCENNISGGCAWIDDWAERLIDLTSKPDAYILKTGHGTKIVEQKPDCEIDYWKPLYSLEKIEFSGIPEWLAKKVNNEQV